MKLLNIGDYTIRPIVVVVPELPERTKFILRELELHGIEPDIYNGFSSEHSGLVTQHTYEIDNPGSGWKIRNKEVATWITFYSLWMALQMQPDEYFLVMEWDVQFEKNWMARTVKALRDTPKDFDMLQLGSCCCMDKPRTLVAGDVWKVYWPACGHATILAKKCIPDLLRTQRKVYAPLDLSLIFHTFEQCNMQIYTMLPRCADQFDTNLAP